MASICQDRLKAQGKKKGNLATPCFHDLSLYCLPLWSYLTLWVMASILFHTQEGSMSTSRGTWDLNEMMWSEESQIYHYNFPASVPMLISLSSSFPSFIFPFLDWVACLPVLLKSNVELPWLHKNSPDSQQTCLDHHLGLNQLFFVTAHRSEQTLLPGPVTH